MKLEQKHLEERKNLITGTDIAAIAGFNPWLSASDVWLQKKGLVELNIDNEYTRWGNALESAIDARYCEETGHKTIACDFIKKGLFAGTPDRLCEDDKQRGLEIKTASFRQGIHYGEQFTDEVPKHYLLQSAWYMMLTDRPVWDLAVLIAGIDFRIYTIRRNQNLEEKLVKLANNWWEKHIVGDVAPELSDTEGAKKWLTEKYPLNSGEIVAATADQIALAREYAKVREEIKTLESKKAAIENNLKLAVGENDGIADHDFKFTWKKCKGSVKVDWEGIAKDMQAPQQLIDKHTRLTNGVRKIYFKSTF